MWRKDEREREREKERIFNLRRTVPLRVRYIIFNFETAKTFHSNRSCSSSFRNELWDRDRLVSSNSSWQIAIMTLPFFTTSLQLEKAEIKIFILAKNYNIESLFCRPAKAEKCFWNRFLLLIVIYCKKTFFSLKDLNNKSLLCSETKKRGTHANVRGRV